jgi:hypothetical protein
MVTCYFLLTSQRALIFIICVGPNSGEIMAISKIKSAKLLWTPHKVGTKFELISIKVNASFNSSSQNVAAVILISRHCTCSVYWRREKIASVADVTVTSSLDIYLIPLSTYFRYTYANGKFKYCHLYEWLHMPFGLVIAFIGRLQFVIISYYSAIANSHTP